MFSVEAVSLPGETVLFAVEEGKRSGTSVQATADSF
jgi:hypothetical protein